MALGATEVAFGADFIKETQRLEAVEVKRVWDAVQRFQGDPNHRSLNFHPLNADPTGRLHTFRASGELRVLVAREGNVYVLLESGHHDDIYERATRGRFIASPVAGFVGLAGVEAADDHVGRAHSQQGAVEGPRPLDHWTDTELAQANFDKGEIAAIRGCATVDEVLELDFGDDPILQLIDMIEQIPEQWFAPSFDPAADAENRIRRAIVEHGALAGISPLFSADEVARLAAAPIEEWMIFLHPDQRSIVEQHYSGPARVRGSAGTGKTVVALHRAAELAQRYRGDRAGPILFTTFIKTLPPVFEQLYDRLPNSYRGAVEFVNIDSLAFRICREAGRGLKVDRNAVDAAYASAWRSVAVAGSPILSAGLTRGYMRDEVNAVIKGRGIDSLQEYLGIERTGRGTRFGEPLRRQAWELRERWDEEMAERRTVDFVDVVRRARDIACAASVPRYRAAIVDEAQDLSMIGLQLLRALVNGGERPDVEDGLLIVGDGAQRIYAGGFTMRQAGVEVRGRTTVLRTNYRNTDEIIQAALAVAGSAEVEDLGEEYQRGDVEAEALRNGVRPALLRCSDGDDEITEVCDRISGLVGSGALQWGDIAVCLATNDRAHGFLKALESREIPALDLAKYDGRSTDRVKVGTHHRAKGLEFKVVFLPGLGADDFPRAQVPGQSDDEYDEVVSLALSQLYVAMTRARDGLFLLASGEPCSIVTDAAPYFEVV